LGSIQQRLINNVDIDVKLMKHEAVICINMS
jgi:hypothetical protein